MGTKLTRNFKKSVLRVRSSLGDGTAVKEAAAHTKERFSSEKVLFNKLQKNGCCLHDGELEAAVYKDFTHQHVFE